MANLFTCEIGTLLVRVPPWLRRQRGMRVLQKQVGLLCPARAKG